MQKSEFFEKLQNNLDNLSETDKNAILHFYLLKLPEGLLPEEEEKIIQGFGDPAEIAKNMKFDFLKEKNEEKENPLSKTNEPEDDEIDLIFSRPHASPISSEIIHSFENKEMKTLYGEKVIIERKSKPIQKIALEPIDEDNGFTPEEIELAKEETLEKASKFNTASLNIPKTSESEPNNCEKTENKVLIEEEEDEAFSEKISGNSDSEKTGIFFRFLSALHLPKESFLILSVFLSVLISPLLLAVFGLSFLSYALVSALIILLAVILFVFMVALIIVGILELVYGFLVLFDNVTIALIELGLGTVLFAFVTAIAAIGYEFIFGVTPRILKKITKFFMSSFKTLLSGIYGGIR